MALGTLPSKSRSRVNSWANGLHAVPLGEFNKVYSHRLWRPRGKESHRAMAIHVPLTSGANGWPFARRQLTLVYAVLIRWCAFRCFGAKDCNRTS
jgi:hypothetical protein